MSKKRLNGFAIFPLITFSLFTSNFINSCSSINVKNHIPNNSNNDFINSNQFFPKIYKEDYYEYVEFINHKPHIGSKLKMRLIKDVVTRVASNKGQIDFFVQDNQKENINDKYQNVDFHFKWTYNETTLYKTYSINFLCK